MGSNFGTRPLWVNPGKEGAKPTRIIATRSSDGKGKAYDVLENQYRRLSGTQDEENSWWRVDLTGKYALYLTHYSLRHGKKDTKQDLLCNWRLEGSFDGSDWKKLKEHKNDQKLINMKSPPYQATWAVKGKLGAFRYFRIYQTGKNSSGRFSLFLSGIELYGVLIEMEVSQEDTTP